MKKLIFILIISLLIIGCSQYQIACEEPYILVGDSCCIDENSNNICDKDESQSSDIDAVDVGKDIELPQKEEEPPTEVEGEPQIEVLEEEVTLKGGETTTYNGKEIKFISVGNFGVKTEFKVEVDGVERDIYDTKTLEIVQGIEVIPLRLDLLKNQVTFKFNVLKLGEYEHLLDTNKNLMIYGKEIRLRNIMDDEAILVDIIDGTLKTRIREGFSKEIDGIQITNVNAFFRDFLDERYAIIKVKEV